MGRIKVHRAPARPATDTRAPAAKTAAQPARCVAVVGSPRAKVPWFPIMLFLGAWLYVWLWIEPPLRYHQSAPEFFLRADFLAGHTGRPAGWLDYAAAWLAQMDCRARLGALVTTALMALVAGGTGLITKRAGRCHPLVPLVPALLLLVLAGRYDFTLLPTGLGAMLAIGAIATWQVWRPNRAGLRWAAFWLATVLVFYLGGPVPSVLFVLLGTLWEAAGSHRACIGPLNRSADILVRNTLPGPSVVAAGVDARPPYATGARRGGAASFVDARVCGAAALVVVGGVLVFPEAVAADLESFRGAGVPLFARGILYLFLLLALWLSCMRAETQGGPGVESRAQGGSRGSSPRSGGSWHAVGWGRWAAGLAVAIGATALTFDGNGKVRIQVESEAQQGRWERALEAAHHLRQSPRPATRLAIHQALAHTGRLTRDLFTFPQRKGADLLPSMREGAEVCGPLSDTLLALGQVGLAEHFAHEALEIMGERPHVLWQLARINVLQGRPLAARVFLHRLRQIPFHRERAERRLQALATDPTLASEADIAGVRPWLVTTDYAESGMPTELLLRQLLQSNRRNRMAFDCLMTHYLLTDQVDALVQSLGVLHEFGLWETPRHLDEALQVHLATKGNGTTEIAGRRVSADTVRRYGEFQARVGQKPGRGPGLEVSFAGEFGNTFWFYQRFGRTLGGAPISITASRK